IVERLENAVFVGHLHPGNICRLRNMPGALRGLVHARRRNDLAGEFISGTNIDELAWLPTVQDGRDVFLEYPNHRVRNGNPIDGWADAKSFLDERALLFEPFLAAAVDEPHIFVAVKLELPESVSREPVVVIAVKNDGGVVRDAGS